MANSNLPRPPVVVILGHVDHGKTTLLDAIRTADVAAKEYGGITQSIGAYQTAGITFIDTPGHEAFTKMRAQGVEVADLAILVVAANDSVMSQTAESIKILQQANIPFIVAINKVDLPEANIDKVIQDLLRHNVLLENYGGQVPFVKISAKKKEGIKELLELIELMAQMNNLQADPAAPPAATVIEAKLDKNRGPVATVIVRQGTLQVGQEIYAGEAKNKIRALIDYQGKNISAAGPGTPVEILGLTSIPTIGAQLVQTPFPPASQGHPLKRASQQSKENTLNLILKTDTLGSLAAILNSLPENINILENTTGEISEADILLAKSTGAIVLGFNVKVTPAAQILAQTEKVLARTYKIIYELLDELRDAAAGALVPETTEEILGKGEIIAEFPYEKLRVCGTKVTEGRIARGDMIRVMRGEEIIGQSRIKSVRVGKEESNKIEKGGECGILLGPQLDFKVGDDIIAYRVN